MSDEKDDASTQLQSADKEGNGDSGDIANTNANGSCNDSPGLKSLLQFFSKLRSKIF